MGKIYAAATCPREWRPFASHSQCWEDSPPITTSTADVASLNPMFLKEALLRGMGVRDPCDLGQSPVLAQQRLGRCGSNSHSHSRQRRLASTPLSEVLRRVRARAKAGKSMRTVGSSVPELEVDLFGRALTVRGGGRSGAGAGARANPTSDATAE